MKNSGVNYGIMFFGYSIGALLGPQIAARFVNQTAGVQAYHSAFIVATVVAIVGFVLSLVIRAMLKKAN